MTRRVALWRDERDAMNTVIPMQDGTKWRHALAMSSAGLRMVEIALTDRLLDMGELRPKQIRTLKRFAQTFGASGAALDALRTLAAEAAAAKAADVAP
jgi:hypothetical protein